MEPSLRDTWNLTLRRAGACAAETTGEPTELESVQHGTDEARSEAILEALGLALVLAITGRLDEVDGETKIRLSRIGRRTLLAPHRGDDDVRWAAAVGKEGLKALAGEHDFDIRAGDVLPPSPARLIAMLRGQPDGLSAGACAIRVQHDPGARQQLAVLLAGAADPITAARPTAQFVAAAAPAESMRDPSTGRRLSEIRSPAADIVLFENEEPRVVAVYALSQESVRLIGDGLLTRHMLPGYWIGTVEPSTTRIEGVLEVGTESVKLEVVLYASGEE